MAETDHEGLLQHPYFHLVSVFQSEISGGVALIKVLRHLLDMLGVFFFFFLFYVCSDTLNEVLSSLSCLEHRFLVGQVICVKALFPCQVCAKILA